MRQWVENLTTILRTRGTDRERGGAAWQYRMRGGLAGNRGWAVSELMLPTTLVTFTQ